MKNKYGIIALILIGLQLLIVFGSWLVAAIFPEINVHSLLSSSGIRWFIGQFTNNLKTDLLVWLLLGIIAFGTFKASGLYEILNALLKGKATFAKFSYQKKVALRLILLEVFVFFMLLFLLVALPEAPLLSVTGSLFPSSFSIGFIPSITFIVTFVSLSYGVSSGRLNTLAKTYNALSFGIILGAKLFPLYILAIELFYSVIYVFNLNFILPL